MTRDESRQKCIDTIEDIGVSLGLMINEGDAQRIFDSLHGLVRVVPVEATQEMKKQFPDNSVTCPCETFEAIAAAGDLTEPRK